MKVVVKPIKVFARFIINKLPEPVRFSYQDVKGNEVSINIDYIQKVKKQKLAGIPTLLDTCVTNNKFYEIRFELETYQWVLFKI